jgi:hypothetical protein
MSPVDQVLLKKALKVPFDKFHKALTRVDFFINQAEKSGQANKIESFTVNPTILSDKTGLKHIVYTEDDQNKMKGYFFSHAAIVFLVSSFDIYLKELLTVFHQKEFNQLLFSRKPDEIKRANFPTLKNLFKNCLDVNIYSTIKEQKITELIEIRNNIIHRGGYLETKNRHKFQLHPATKDGSILFLTVTALEKKTHLVVDVVNYIEEAIYNKYSIGGVPPRVETYKDLEDFKKKHT